MATTGNSCFWLDDLKKSSPLSPCIARCSYVWGLWGPQKLCGKWCKIRHSINFLVPVRYNNSKKKRLSWKVSFQYFLCEIIKKKIVLTFQWLCLILYLYKQFLRLGQNLPLSYSLLC
jgi:hypothetical protein